MELPIKKLRRYRGQRDVMNEPEKCRPDLGR